MLQKSNTLTNKQKKYEHLRLIAAFHGFLITTLIVKTSSAWIFRIRKEFFIFFWKTDRQLRRNTTRAKIFSIL